MLNSFAQNTLVVLVLQTLGSITGYGTQVFLAQCLGVTDYGNYDYILAWGLFLGYISGLGLPNALLRFIPEYVVKRDWGRLWGLVWRSWKYVFLFGIFWALLGTLIAFLINQQTYFDLLTLLLSAWLIPFLALVRHQMEMLKGMGKFVLAYTPYLIMFPLLICIYLFFIKQTNLIEINEKVAISITIINLITIILVQLLMFRFNLPVEWSSQNFIYAEREWFSVAIPLLLIDGAFIVLNQSDILMIGFFLESNAVGIYSAAAKTANWVSFFLVAINAVAAPMFSKLYSQNHKAELQNLVYLVAHWMFWPSFIIALILISFSEFFLHLFGSEFVIAKGELFILIIGQLVNVGAGSVGYLMQMTGNQNKCAYVFLSSALLNIILNAVLIPNFGLLGAAVSTAFTMSLWNIWLHQLVVRNVGVKPSIIHAFKYRQ